MNQISTITSFIVEKFQENPLVNTLTFEKTNEIDYNKENIYPLVNVDVVNSRIEDNLISINYTITVLTERDIDNQLNNDKLFGSNLIDNLNEAHTIASEFINWITITNNDQDLELESSSDINLLKLTNGALDGVRFSMVVTIPNNPCDHIGEHDNYTRIYSNQGIIFLDRTGESFRTTDGDIYLNIANIETSSDFQSIGIDSNGKIVLNQNPFIDTYTTGFTYSNNVATIKQNQGTADLSITIDTMTGLTVNGITNVDSVVFDTTATTVNTIGGLNWNDADGTLNLGLKGGNVSLQLGQEQVVRVVNKTGANLLESQYKVVRVRVASEGGAQGQKLAVVLAQANNDADSVTTLGIVTEDINNNQEGFITTFGNVSAINTTGSLQGETWVDGDVLYLSPTVPGQLTKIKPIAPQHSVTVGYVVYSHAINGKIFVKVDNGYELDELHNVLLSGLTNNNVLTYDSSTGLWKNKSVSTALGYTPENQANKSNSYTVSSTTTYPNTKALVDGLATKADYNDVVHINGDETIYGSKTFDSPIDAGNVNTTFLDVTDTFGLHENGGPGVTYLGYYSDGIMSGLGAGNIIASAFKVNDGLSSQFLKADGSVDPTTYASQDGTILYHSVKWFTPTGTVSVVGTTVTSVGTQFTSAMVGAKLTINGEWRIITGYTNTTTVTISSAYSSNYSGVAAANWGVYSKAQEYTNTGNYARYSSLGVLIQNNIQLLNMGWNGDFGTNGGEIRLGQVNVKFNNVIPIQWSSTSDSNGTKDLGIRRNSAGVLEIYDGVTADGAVANRRDLLVRNITSTGLQTFQGTTASDSAPLGAELTTTATGTNWTGTSFASGYTHTTGSTVALTSTLAAVNGTYYQVTYTITGRTAGSITINYGGSARSAITNNGNTGILATSTAVLNIVPTTDFNGTLTLSIKTIGTSIATTKFLNSTGGVANELRASSNVSNYFSGADTGQRNTTGIANTVVGNQAYYSSPTASYNTAVGYQAMMNTVLAMGNTVVGSQALMNMVGSTNSGYNNVVMGSTAGMNLTNGIFNIILGSAAGTKLGDKTTNATNFSSSIMIGYNASQLGNNQSNQIVIGHDSTGLGTNTTVLGNSSTVQTWLGGRVTIGSTTDDGSNAFQLTGIAKLNTTPTTSAGSYDILTRNSSTGVVEKKLNSDFVHTTGAETISGIKTFNTAIKMTNLAPITIGSGSIYFDNEFNELFINGGGTTGNVVIQGTTGGGAMLKGIDGAFWVDYDTSNMVAFTNGETFVVDTAIGGSPGSGSMLLVEPSGVSISYGDLNTSNINSTGTVSASQFKLAGLNTAPASATAAGTTGEIRYDANFIYLCVAANTWKRSALTTW